MIEVQSRTVAIKGIVTDNKNDKIICFVAMHDHHLTQVVVHGHERTIVVEMRAEFERLAIAILQKMYTSDASVCEKALKSVWARYDNLTYIDLAYRAHARDFIAHPACQEICERRWKGDVISEVNVIKVLLCTLCPLLLLFPILSFRSDGTTKQRSLVSRFRGNFKGCAIC
eukprot:sb/3472193/